MPFPSGGGICIFRGQIFLLQFFFSVFTFYRISRPRKNILLSIFKHDNIAEIF